ncbi:unnamed protein product [Rhizoctonia solani]|uniref:Uncharacterized protein n=1 Tax=Rhizoctonia solani TaxID=456999 RepID=A0A8H2WB27_9AGAM|nr:unnamed protein product [Rhizoctonia solani]
MSHSPQLPVGTQVWAKMPSAPEDGHLDTTEVLSWIVGHERQGDTFYYHCKAPESRGIWSSSNDEVVRGITTVRPSRTQGAQFELEQSIRVKKRVEWRRSGANEHQKSGRICAGWCKRVEGPDGYFLEYTYWVAFTGSDQGQPRNWYPQPDLES